MILFLKCKKCEYKNTVKYPDYPEKEIKRLVGYCPKCNGELKIAKKIEEVVEK